MSEGIVTIRSAVKTAFQVLHERYENRNSPKGLPTGFAALNDSMGGLRVGELVALVPELEPRADRSAFAAQIAASVAAHAKEPVYVISMRYSATEYTMRLIAALGSVDRNHLRDGGVVEEEWPGVTAAITMLSDARMVIDDAPAQTVSSLKSRLRTAQRQYGVRLIVIDSLDLMEGPNPLLELRALARELEATVLVLADALNPSIEDQADVILLLDCEVAAEKESALGQDAMLTIVRRRNGFDTNIGALHYLPQYARFEEWSKGEPEYVSGFVNEMRSPVDDKGIGELGLREKAGEGENGDFDDLYDKAVAIVIESRHASISLVQRRLMIGYNHAARLIELMEQRGVVGQLQSNGIRKVFVPSPKG